MNISHHYLAPAKINLFLHITGQRADGYHTLQSIFLFLDYYDRLQFRVTEDGKISRVDKLADVTEQDDLCMRAAKALQQATACQLGVQISLQKNIPMGGGLGGGSSDAATVLMALNDLWGLHLSRIQLMEIGLTLGADVPVFIFGQTAWAEGVGEQLTTIDLPELWQKQTFVVLTPQVHVSTAQIFSHSGLTRSTKPLKIADFSKRSYAELFNNDLEQVVCKEYTAVADTLNWLNQFGQARMSGSGASVFVAVESKQAADKILSEKPKNTVGFVANGLKYHPHFDLLD